MISVTFSGDNDRIVSEAAYQYDYGQTLEINGLDLEPLVEVDFSADGDDETITMTGSTSSRVTTVDIPNDMFLKSWKWDYKVHAYIYVTDATSGITVKHIIIPVRHREERSEEEPTPTQQSALDAAIAHMSEYAIDIDTTLTQSGDAADAAAVGTEISAIKDDIANLPSIADTDAEDVDLDLTDSSGNVIMRLADGHVQTKEFDSSTLAASFAAKISTQQSAEDAGKALVVGDDGTVAPADVAVEVDDTLTQSGEAADAKAVGDAIAAIGTASSPVSVMDSDATDVDLDLTDNSGNVLMRLKDGHIQTKNFDSSSIIPTSDTGVVAQNAVIEDGIYAACRYHQPSASSKQFCMLIAGDIHEDATRMARIVTYLNAIDAFDCGIMLGDIAGSDFLDDTTYYTSALASVEKPFLTVIGNHDAGSDNKVANCYTNLSDLIAKIITPNIQYADLASGEYVSGNGYYYKDFSTYGIRIIVLNQYEYPTDNNGTTFTYRHGWSCYSQSQITWLCDTLASTPSNYGVIIALHSNPHSVAIDHDSDFTASTMTYNSITPESCMDVTNGGVLVDIVDAWINGTSLSQTYGYTVSGSWSDISVNVDFSSRGTGEFITWLGGHWHMSIKSTSYHHTDQQMYTVDCASLTSSTQGDTPRKEGTRSEDCFCAIAVDRSNRKVKIFRVGAHFTKDGADRLYGAYTY